jgi:hypothetical protein
VPSPGSSPVLAGTNARAGSSSGSPADALAGSAAGRCTPRTPPRSTRPPGGTLAEAFHEVGPESTGHGRRRGLVGCLGRLAEFVHRILRQLRDDVPEPMSETPLTQRRGEALLRSRFNPGAPSVPTRSGSPRPRRFMSCRKSRRRRVTYE